MNKSLKIGVFAYNFPHYKTQQGLLNLFVNNIKIDIVFMAEPVKLNFYQSKIRVAPKYISLNNTKDLTESLGISSCVVKHNSDETIDLVKKYNLDLGIILGARILKQNVIDSFKIGVLNMHPGIIPINRGLDNLKWAIIDKMKQGVTTHLISNEIDKGKLIDIQELDVFEDDTLIDIHIRLQELEQNMMIEAIKKLQNGFIPLDILADGKYNKAVDLNNELLLIDQFEFYKKNYSNMKGIN